MKSSWLRIFIIDGFFLAILAACAGIPETVIPPTATQITSLPGAANTAVLQPTTTQTSSPQSTRLQAITPTAVFTATDPPQVTPTYDPGSWENLPVIPTISETARQIYGHGLELGNDPHAFSKIGDCETAAPWFLADFDSRPDQYSLGSYTNLQVVIQQFAGSFKRTSLAARIGFTAASVLNPIWADPKLCQTSETPLACEVRLQRPSFAFILLGTNDAKHLSSFEPNMRTIVEYLIDHGVVPILVTKADNLEGDQSINNTIARLAYEYDIPLWNFWLAVQPLPKNGLQDDLAHLTWAPNFFDNPEDMKSGWAVRNLTALQVLDATWTAVANP